MVFPCARSSKMPRKWIGGGCPMAGWGEQKPTNRSGRSMHVYHLARFTNHDPIWGLLYIYIYVCVCIYIYNMYIYIWNYPTTTYNNQNQGYPKATDQTEIVGLQLGHHLAMSSMKHPQCIPDKSTILACPT